MLNLLTEGDNMIGNDWDKKLEVIWNSEGFKKFYRIIEKEYDTKTIFPP